MYATIITDLGFGDAGKGTMVDYFAQRAQNPVIVRFNGGAQAAHNVHTSDGKHHTFSQFGSGTLTSTARTFLSRYVLLDPLALHTEARALQELGVRNPLSRVMVDGDALVVTPFQKAANRVREAMRGDGRHGSVGMGIGETMADQIAFPHLAVYARDLRDRETLTRKLAALQELKYAEFGQALTDDTYRTLLPEETWALQDPAAPRMLASLFAELAQIFTLVSATTLARLAQTHPLIFEGAQGVLIDEWHGFHPYTTWSTTTDANARKLLSDIDYQGPVTSYGVVRTYSTRHGPGPFPSEDRALTTLLPDRHNVFGKWQGGFRVGYLDLPLTRYALAVSERVDEIALTHLDRLAHLPQKKVVVAYAVADDSLTLRERSAIVVAQDMQVPPGMTYIASFNRKPDLEDLSYQEMLGAILQKATPVYASIERGGELYADVIAQYLSRPVGITSYGVTAQEKRQRLSLARVA